MVCVPCCGHSPLMRVFNDLCFRHCCRATRGLAMANSQHAKPLLSYLLQLIVEGAPGPAQFVASNIGRLLSDGGLLSKAMGAHVSVCSSRWWLWSAPPTINHPLSSLRSYTSKRYMAHFFLLSSNKRHSLLRRSVKRKRQRAKLSIALPARLHCAP